MNVLLSMKPKHAENILNGLKLYEFRKNIFRRNDYEKVLIYSSSPVKKLVGFFIVGKIIEEHPIVLWEQLNQFSGLTEKEFFEYFKNHKKGYAIEIKQAVKFNDPIEPIEILPNFMAPQSFCYIEDLTFKKEG